MWTHAENKWGGFGKFDVDRTASLGKPAWHISAIFSLALAETVVWWRRRRRLDRWRHFRSAWRHQRPPAGVQAASGNDARSSDWLSATHRRTRCHGLYSVILNAPVLIVIFVLFFTDHYTLVYISPSMDQRSGTAFQRLCGRRSYHCSRFGET